MPSKTAVFEENLANEYRLFKILFGLLKSEQAVLIENQIEQLAEMAQKKTEIIDSLNKLEDRRIDFLKQHMPNLTRPEITAWIERECQPECHLTWDALIGLARQAHAMNQINGKLIESKLGEQQHALLLLRQLRNQGDLYGPNGHPAHGSTGSHIIGEV